MPENPCDVSRYFCVAMLAAPGVAMGMTGNAGAERSLGVTIEAPYTVGEYDIVILSASESTGLETWLRGNGYRIPAGATAVHALTRHGSVEVTNYRTA